MAAECNGAVSRWDKPLDTEQFEHDEMLRRKRMMAAFGVLIVIVLIVIFAVAVKGGKGTAPAPASSPKPVRQSNNGDQPVASNNLPTDPEQIKALLSNPTNPVVRITTDKGDMLVELFEDKVPNTAANFVSLADDGFYEGMTWHRIIPDFMAQGGCPYSKKGGGGMPGTGGPGYNFADEFHPTLRHTGAGILSMANAGPNTNGSQFFLCFVATPHLDNRHSVFGKVVAGEETLRLLERVGSPSGKTRETVGFNVQVVFKQDHAYEVKKR